MDIYRKNFETPEEIEEPYEVKMPKKEPYQIEIFEKKITIPFLSKYEIEEEIEGEEDTDRMIYLKIRVLNDKIENEQNNQIKIVNYQENNVFKIIASFLCTVIMCLILVIIEQYAHLTWYMTLEDISITDLESVGSLFFIPLVLVLIAGIIINTGWQILLLKRTYVIEDPHDHIRKSYDTVLKRSRERVQVYERQIEELKLKLIELKKNNQRISLKKNNSI